MTIQWPAPMFAYSVGCDELAGRSEWRVSVLGHFRRAELSRTFFPESRPRRSQVPTRRAFAVEPGIIWF